jgi:predicted RNA-binding Zn-ribbon protein involved in translation (DUF1610 family)
MGTPLGRKGVEASPGEGADAFTCPSSGDKAINGTAECSAQTKKLQYVIAADRCDKNNTSASLRLWIACGNASVMIEGDHAIKRMARTKESEPIRIR